MTCEVCEVKVHAKGLCRRHYWNSAVVRARVRRRMDARNLADPGWQGRQRWVSRHRDGVVRVTSEAELLAALGRPEVFYAWSM